MEEELDYTTITPAEPSALLVLLALLVAALALKVVLTAAREGERLPGWPATLAALWPGALAWALGLWAAGLLTVAGLEPVADLRFALADAAWLFLATLLSAWPALLWQVRRRTQPDAAVRLGGTALLLALPALAVPMGWLHAARLDPVPLWLPLWPALGCAVAAVGLGAALVLAYSTLGERALARRLWRSAAAVVGAVALVLGQVLVHEGALVSDQAFSGASASLPVALMSGVGALVPLLLIGLMVLQRLRRYAAEDRRARPGARDRRRHTPRPQGASERRAASPRGVAQASAPSDSVAQWASSLPAQAGQPRRRSKQRRHRVL